MFKKMIIALMLVLAMFSLVGCSTGTLSKTTTYTASGVIEQYYVNDVEVPYEIYVDCGGK